MSQANFLNIIKSEVSSEKQGLWIQSAGAGLPDGGSFKLQLGSDITTDILYDQNYNYVETTMRRAIEPYAQVRVVGSSATRFIIEFEGESAGLSYPIMKVKENSLTLSGQPAGLIQISRMNEGGLPKTVYTFLKQIPLSQWSITSFNPQTREVCVEINNDAKTVNLIVTLPPLV